MLRARQGLCFFHAFSHRVMCKTLYWTIIGLLWVRPWLQAQEPPGTASNAATILRRAFELVPEFTAEQKQWLRDGSGPTDENHAQLLKSMERSLQLMRQAAEMPECYWEIPWEEEGMHATLPHLVPMRTLSRMAQWHAEAQLPRNPRGFLDDSLAALSCARHVGREGPLISLLVECAMETVTMDSLARHLPELPGDVLASLAAAHPVPAGGDLHTAISMEKAIGADWFIKKVRQAMEKRRDGRDGTPSHVSSATALADQFRLRVDLDGPLEDQTPARWVLEPQHEDHRCAGTLAAHRGDLEGGRLPFTLLVLFDQRTLRAASHQKGEQQHDLDQTQVSTAATDCWTGNGRDNFCGTCNQRNDGW